MNMTSRPFPHFRLDRVTRFPVTTSGRSKSGAAVPKDIMVEAVRTMVRPPGRVLRTFYNHFLMKGAAMDKNVFKSHPWHGVPIGPEAPAVVTAYIEIVPTDTVKYEMDKQSGYLKVDRPQKFSNICPTLYGLIPQTLC